MTDLLNQLIALLGADAVLTGADVSLRARAFFDPAPMQARAIVRPRTTEQVAAVLRQCSEQRQPIVPLGGATNLVESARTTPLDLALSLERMSAIEQVDRTGRTLTAQAGVTLEQVQQAAEQAGLFFPLDLAARGSATLGGAAATNAGGVRVLRYGMMRQLVLGLEVVLADGVILSSLNRMLKNNAGYDLKQIFIGSEGTLGVITRVVVRLFPRPRAAATALLAIEQFDRALALLELAGRDLSDLTSFEVMWPDYYRLTTTPPAPSIDPFHESHNLYVLIETLGGEGARERMEAFLSTAVESALIADAVLAQSESQRQALWRIREDSEQIERQHTPTFGFDVSLPQGAMEEYVAATRRTLAATFEGCACWVYGHLADGNLHLSAWAPGMTPSDRPRVERLVYEPLARLGGSISAEHGIGLEKKPYLGLSRTPEEIEVMRRLKRALDPRGILNPGKVFDL